LIYKGRGGGGGEGGERTPEDIGRRPVHFPAEDHLERRWRGGKARRGKHRSKEGQMRATELFQGVHLGFSVSEGEREKGSWR